MRMQVASLGVDMPDRDLGANGDVGEGVGHTASTEGVLELGAHEPVSFARVTEDKEVDAEHGHVEDHGDEDEADRAGDEVPDEEPRRDAEVAEKIPELLERTEAYSGDGEETDPLAADDSAEGETGHDEPYPPRLRERLEVILVAERSPCERGEGSEEDEGRVEEDVAGLGDETVFEGDQERGQEGGGDSAVERAQGKVGEGNGRDAHESGDHAHRDIRDVLVHSGMTSVEYGERAEEERTLRCP